MSDPGDRGPLWRRLAAIFAQESLTPNERLLLVVLEWYAKDGVAWPSIPTLGRRTGLTERTVYTLLAQLEQAEALDVDHGGGRRRPNHYEITLKPFQGFDGVTQPETLKSTTETLKSTHENPEAVSGERSIERSSRTPTLRPSDGFALLKDDGADDVLAAVQGTVPDGVPEPDLGPGPGAAALMERVDLERLAGLRQAVGHPAALPAAPTPEEFEARKQAALAQAAAYAARRAG